mmetsp:Transcript_26151/g.48776  ORF Transcript_26151/g.48776 Transcript_26151/m.48776 type:complete len:149 (-) Transcript_26151:556-1002(-)|eukprot:CAMPEP_0170172512 /NCGR_PEP_ID=MMETSP0040_2-20121228/5750_1 /TAXON_ID=641309 /ORGANISM="Lotharella oceanica, Strain CCMP622" /LENGTH=148 /DNA_ID=CAMNT_0010413201 /DNA_START=176 /DNA_END=622 /DNA_ORIENTATION=-
MVPYGNARMQFGKVSCQHGEEECEGNRWEQCAIAHYPDASDYFPFYYCMESEGDNMLSNVKKCASDANLDYSVLSTCFNGAESNELQKKAAAMTPSDHQYVPWVLINGVKSPSDGDNILEEVCSAYTGEAPKACQSLEKAKGWKRCYA